MNALTTVRGQETKTFQTLAKYIKEDSDRQAAIRALQHMPKTFWPRDEAAPLVETLLAYIRKVPAKERTSPAALDAQDFAERCPRSLLPASRARRSARAGRAGRQVIRIGTLPERMSYDRDLVIKAGKPVEFLFENTDLMPHNLAIVQPGSMEEIGMQAEATATQADAQAKRLHPRSNKVLLASKLLQPRESRSSA